MNIAELRKFKHLSQRDAAKLTGMSIRTYQNYEYGKSRLTTFAGRAIIKALTSYEPYSEDHGILPFDLIKQEATKAFSHYKIDSAFLFGSYAKENPNGRSEVVILIVSDIKAMAVYSLESKLKETLHKKVNIIRFSDISNNSDLLLDIIKCRKPLYDGKKNG